jgi:hypothetical protein
MKTIPAEVMEAIKAHALDTYEYREENGIDNCGPDFAESAYELGCDSRKLAETIDEILTTRMLRARA